MKRGQIRFGDSASGVTVVIAESASAAEDDAGASRLSTYSWPAALVLGQWLVQHADVVSGCRVLELGCGVGVCGWVAAAAGATSVLCTDLDPRALDLVAAGGCSGAAITAPPMTAVLDWNGFVPPLPPGGTTSHATTAAAAAAAATGVFDVILASDTLFDAKSYLPFLCCVAVHLRAAHAAGVATPRCIMAHVVRNSVKTIAPMLRALGLTGRALPAPSGVIWRSDSEAPWPADGEDTCASSGWTPHCLDTDTVAVLELRLGLGEAGRSHRL